MKQKLPKQAGKKTAKKILALPVMCLCLLAALAAIVFLRGRLPEAGKSIEGRKPAGTVNGEPFFREDMAVYALELRAAVAAQYGKRYQLSGMGARFWDTEFDGATPRQTLEALATQDLIRNMVLLQEARHRGIDAPAVYGDLESEREAWNAPTDEIVYGPKQLGSAEFNSYRIGGIRDELKTMLLKKELAPSTAQLRAAFDRLGPELKQAPYSVSGVMFTWNRTGAAAESSSGAAVENIRGALERALREGQSPEAAAAGLAAGFPAIEREAFAINSQYISKEDSYEQELTALLRETVPGSLVPAPDNRPAVYYVQQKEGGGTLRFEDAPGLGRNKWINDQFELFLDRKVKKARIRLFKEALINSGKR
jgi:hypothetical protein